MTNDEKKRIERLRKNGNSFLRIAEVTGLSKDSIRMYCSRNKIVIGKSSNSCCQQCGKELLVNTGKGRKALFCSSNCRITYWRKMKEKDRNYTKVCACCEKEFFSYRKARKYCSHECYINARFGGNHEA